MQYLQWVSYGDTAVLHLAIDISIETVKRIYVSVANTCIFLLGGWELISVKFQ